MTNVLFAGFVLDSMLGLITDHLIAHALLILLVTKQWRWEHARCLWGA